MRLALASAQQSPPRPTNFRVGAVLLGINVDGPKVISTGYTLELPGNTHAEQCCLVKYAAEHGVEEDKVGSILPSRTVLFTTMEPCGVRLSGNEPCAERILKTREEGRHGIGEVYMGVKEPETFVGESNGRVKLEKAGVQCVYVAGFEEEILRVATAGHEREQGPETIGP